MTGARAPAGEFRDAFGRAPEVVARAPGRVEFIGNHTDYNGGTVLGGSIDRSVRVALALRTDGLRRFRSDRSDQFVELRAADGGKVSGGGSWVNYALGVLDSMRDFGVRAPGGFDFLATSDLPIGAGLSSSAAMELASGLAFLGATGQSLPRESLVGLCKQAENRFVGVPCGILDQAVSGFGRKDHLVLIDCRGPRFSTVPLPPGAHFWIFNTHTKHELVDGLYAARHRECMEAARALGVGLLADIGPAELARRMAASPVPHAERARHVVEEIARVDAAVAALKAGDLAATGPLLTASHRSSQSLFGHSTPELDFLVDALSAMPHVFGARLTGGGFGGAVMALTGPGFDAAMAEIPAGAFEKKFGARPDVLHLLTADGAEIVNRPM